MEAVTPTGVGEQRGGGKIECCSGVGGGDRGGGGGHCCPCWDVVEWSGLKPDRWWGAVVGDVVVAVLGRWVAVVLASG